MQAFCLSAIRTIARTILERRSAIVSILKQFNTFITTAFRPFPMLPKNRLGCRPVCRSHYAAGLNQLASINRFEGRANNFWEGCAMRNSNQKGSAALTGRLTAFGGLVTVFITAGLAPVAACLLGLIAAVVLAKV
jgi:hypothetical protein